MRKVLMMFGTLNDADMDWFIQVGRVRRYAAGEPIITERQPTDAIFIILDGWASVTVRGTHVARVTSGEILGEVSLVDSRLPTASVIADQETAVLVIDRAALRGRLRTDPAFGSRFYHALAIVLAQRLQRNTPGAPPPDPDQDDADDVEAGILDNLSLAGLRFDHLLKRTLRAG